MKKEKFPIPFGIGNFFGGDYWTAGFAGIVIRKAAQPPMADVSHLVLVRVPMKKSRHPTGWRDFLVETTGLEPVTSCV